MELGLTIVGVVIAAASLWLAHRLSRNRVVLYADFDVEHRADGRFNGFLRLDSVNKGSHPVETDIWHLHHVKDHIIEERAARKTYPVSHTLKPGERLPCNRPNYRPPESHFVDGYKAIYLRDQTGRKWRLGWFALRKLNKTIKKKLSNQ